MEQPGTFECVAPIWLDPGSDGWHFVSLPAETSDDLDEVGEGIRQGDRLFRTEAESFVTGAKNGELDFFDH